MQKALGSVLRNSLPRKSAQEEQYFALCTKVHTSLEVAAGPHTLDSVLVFPEPKLQVLSSKSSQHEGSGPKEQWRLAAWFLLVSLTLSVLKTKANARQSKKTPTPKCHGSHLPGTTPTPTPEGHKIINYHHKQSPEPGHLTKVENLWELQLLDLFPFNW